LRSRAAVEFGAKSASLLKMDSIFHASVGSYNEGGDLIAQAENTKRIMV